MKQFLLIPILALALCVFAATQAHAQSSYLHLAEAKLQTKLVASKLHEPVKPVFGPCHRIGPYHYNCAVSYRDEPTSVPGVRMRCDFTSYVSKSPRGLHTAIANGVCVEDR